MINKYPALTASKLVLFLAFLAPLAAIAQNITRPNIQGPAGIQVNSFNGNLYYERRDLFIPGRGMPLNFSFTYNTAKTSINLGYGNGWTCSSQLVYEKDGGDIVIRRGDGRRDVFTFNGSAYDPPIGIFDSLSEYQPGKYRLRAKDGSCYFFDDNSHKRLTRAVDRQGNTLSWSYPHADTTIVRDAADRSVYLYHSNGLLRQLLDSLDGPPRIWAYAYDENDNLRSVTNPLGDSISYTYDRNRRLSGLTDARGSIFAVSYNEFGFVDSLRSPLTRAAISYDRQQLKSILSERVGAETQQTAYEFDSTGNLIAQRGNCCGFDVEYQYDSDGNITRMTDARGMLYRYRYDDRGNLLAKIDPLGDSITHSYEQVFNRRTATRDKKGYETTFSYDTLGNLLTVRRPHGVTEAYAYDSLGNRILYVNGRGDSTRYSYDNNGYRSAISYPIGTESFEYDNSGNLGMVISPNGDSTRYEYDALDRLTKITDALGGESSYSYDANGNLVSQNDPNGNITHYSYDELDRLLQVAAPHSATTTYAYDERGNRLRVKDPNGNTTHFEYDGRNLLSKEINPLGDSRSFSYDASGNQVKESDFKGNTTSYAYDSLDRLISITDALANVTSYSYDANGNRIAIKDARNNTTSFVYDSLDRQTMIIGPLSDTSRFFYDRNGNLLREQDANGNITVYSFDANDRRDTIFAPHSSTSVFVYDANGNRIAMTDPRGNTTKFSYDALDRLTEEVNALADTTRFGYDANGNRVFTSDARNNTTSYRYDSLDRQTLLISPLNDTTHYFYDPNGNRTQERDANGHVTRFTFDENNRLDSIKASLASTSSFVYDANGNRLQVKDPNGNATDFSYDELNRLTREINAEKDTTRYSYDANGNQDSISLPNGNLLTYSYDALDRLIRTADLLGTSATFSYDAKGNRLTITDGNGNTNSRSYDSLDRVTTMTDALDKSRRLFYDANSNLIRERDRNGIDTRYTYDALNRRDTVIDALNYRTNSTYDAVNNLASITDANGNTTTYTYDALNRLSIETFADTTSKQYAYDGVGNLIRRIDNKGDTTLYRYDALNRLTLRDYPDDNDDEFSYDTGGRMLSAKNAHAELYYDYDRADRMLHEVLNGDTTAYAYDIANRTRTLFYPGGREIVEHFDLRNQLDSIREGSSTIVDYDYDAGDRVTTRSYPMNGTTSAYVYDADNRLSSIIHNPDTLAGFNYAYDAEGNRLYEEKIHRPTHSQQYGFDSLNRVNLYKVGKLISGKVDSAITQTLYKLDGVHNRISIDVDGDITNYSANNMNEYFWIAGADTTQPLHDTKGNLIGDGAHSYSFDFENRLIKVNGGTTASYCYDPLGRRIRKIVGDDTTSFNYDGVRVIEERGASACVEATYLYGGWVDEMLQMKCDAEQLYYYHNAQFSVVAVALSVGAAIESYDYTAFGTVTIYDSVYVPMTSSAIGNSYLLTGRRFDEESELYNFRARYYNAILGRFVSRDPLKYIDGMGLYEYVKSNPFKFVDPLGTTTVHIGPKFNVDEQDLCCLKIIRRYQLYNGPTLRAKFMRCHAKCMDRYVFQYISEVLPNIIDLSSIAFIAAGKDFTKRKMAASLARAAGVRVGSAAIVLKVSGGVLVFTGKALAIAGAPLTSYIAGLHFSCTNSCNDSLCQSFAPPIKYWYTPKGIIRKICYNSEWRYRCPSTLDSRGPKQKSSAELWYQTVIGGE